MRFPISNVGLKKTNFKLLCYFFCFYSLICSYQIRGDLYNMVITGTQL